MVCISKTGLGAMVALVASVLFHSIGPVAHAADKPLRLVLNTGHNPPLATDAHDGFHDRLAIEAYRRAGIDISIVRLPSARSGHNANAGIEDGNGPRIASYNKHFPNLVRIDEVAIDFDFVGFTTDGSVQPSDWDDLDPYVVGIVTGWKILEVNITRSHQLTKVSNADQLFALLKTNRADVVFIERWQGLQAAKNVGLKEVQVLDPPFASKPMYFYLHKKHAALAPKVAEALRSMKADGTYGRILEETLGKLRSKLESNVYQR